MFEQDVSSDAFDAFALPAVLNSSSVQVIIDSDVDVIDENTGESRFYSHLISMYKSDSENFEKSDTLTFNGKSFELQDIVEDDGIIVLISAV